MSELCEDEALADELNPALTPMLGELALLLCDDLAAEQKPLEWEIYGPPGWTGHNGTSEESEATMRWLCNGDFFGGGVPMGVDMTSHFVQWVDMLPASFDIRNMLHDCGFVELCCRRVLSAPRGGPSEATFVPGRGLARVLLHKLLQAPDSDRVRDAICGDATVLLQCLTLSWIDEEDDKVSEILDILLAVATGHERAQEMMVEQHAKSKEGGWCSIVFVCHYAKMSLYRADANPDARPDAVPDTARKGALASGARLLAHLSQALPDNMAAIETEWKELIGWDDARGDEQMADQYQMATSKWLSGDSDVLDNLRATTSSGLGNFDAVW